MWDDDLSRRSEIEGSEALGDEAVPLVQEDPGRPYFGKIFASVAPEWGDEDALIDWDDSTARWDDAFWSFFAFAAVFRWQTYFNWWVARRYVMPRDPRRR